MSLVCHRIVSTYTPQERETIVEDVEQNDAWEREQFFGKAKRLHSRPAPTFIPAALKYDEFGMPKVEEEVRVSQCPQTKEDVASWYRNMAIRSKLNDTVETGRAVTNPPLTSTSNLMQFTALRDNRPSPQSDWFSLRRLDEPIKFQSVPSTLIDLLTRNPPPLPSQPAFTPPVFLALGPSNKGFTMLQKKGWREGEGLGRILRGGSNTELEQRFTPEVVDLTQSDDEEVKQAIIDLTKTDSEAESGDEDGNRNGVPLGQKREEEAVSIPAEDKYEFPTHGGTALITPIGTVLKADRLGIGLKARRAKKKAVTHSAAEISAFIRTRKKMEKQKWGRGSKGLARKNKEEERRRVQMLKYLNE